ncbi:AAA family ATPase [Candidatus Babeliales bacterium]|nr:AAA family ATPase [Candidatus Babeliales bacterium]
MKRIIDFYLKEWKISPYRKPLLLRGARQVGKTYAVQQLGKSFDNILEVNFEADDQFKSIFDHDLDPHRIVRDLALHLGTTITPGKTLIFLDEIQTVPRALTALRYFYEKFPEQHIIAAGSLLDFALKEVGIPVGRVSSLYVHPLSFFEFLCATKQTILAKAILNSSLDNPFSETIHEKLLTLVGHYLAIGGMPEAVDRWANYQDPQACVEIHRALIDTYRQDFNKYANKFQLLYINLVFNAVPRQIGSKFKYSLIEGDYRKRELAPCLDLLCIAGIAHTICHSAGNGVPLGAEADLSDYKTIFLDVALCQTVLGLNLKGWFLHPHQEFINKSPLVEAFIGQELLAHAHPTQKSNLFYWRRNTKGSEAEVDYLMQENGQIIPLEVKSGTGSTLKSMRMFLDSHPQSPYGIRFSTNNYSQHEKIMSWPLYAIAGALLQNQPETRASYESLF